MPTDDQHRQRLDQRMVALGLAESRARARDAIRRGTVTIDGEIAAKPAMMVGPNAAISCVDRAKAYVSRAALKLIAGLDHFGFDPGGRVALDIGASTGGFTQVLLKRGAARVYAFDVGHGQLHERLKNDSRVIMRDGINARHLCADDLDEPPGVVVCDVSFISLKLALAPALRLAAPGAWGVFLMKPQFEVGRDGLGKGGIVRDASAARRTLDGIAAWLDGYADWSVAGTLASPIAGGDGNTEFLVGAVRNGR